MTREQRCDIARRGRGVGGVLVVLVVTASTLVAGGAVPASALGADGALPQATVERVVAVRGATTGSEVIGRADVPTFQMLGAHYTAASSNAVDVRVRWNGVWTSWMHLDGGDGSPDGREPAAVGQSLRVRTEPLWVGRADAYQVAFPDGTTEAEVYLVREASRGTSDVPRGDTVATVAEVGTAALASPPILTRSAWGARKEKVIPTVAPSIELAVVHHTAAAGQGYSAGDVPAMLRGIQAYHMDANGWDDIAYNFAVDRFGRIWEARAGGISRAVRGGHAKGFNRRSVGVVVLGDFRSDAISEAAVTAVGDLLGWKLFINGVDPTGVVRMISAGNPRFAEGTAVTLDTITGHGDTGSTSCPGGNLTVRLPSIRLRAASMVAALTGNGTFAERRIGEAGLAGPLRGDFNGDGRGDVFWYGAASIPDQVWYGTAEGWFANSTARVAGTYDPFVGDFDRDGRSDVFWYASGDVADAIWFGSANGFVMTRTSVSGEYTPVVGDFDGDLRSDVLWYGPGSARDALWLAAPGRGWITKSASVAGVYQPVVGDFNEDDLSDVLWFGSGEDRDGLWFGRPGGFRSASVAVPYVAVPLVGDMAGGRGSDLLWYGAGAAPDALWTSSWSGEFNRRSLSVSGSYRPVVADVDGGGRDDVIWYGIGAGPDTLWRSRGDGSFASSTLEIPFDAVGIAVDGNGDGLDDLLWYGPGAAPDFFWRSIR